MMIFRSRLTNRKREVLSLWNRPSPGMGEATDGSDGKGLSPPKQY